MSKEINLDSQNKIYSCQFCRHQKNPVASSLAAIASVALGIIGILAIAGIIPIGTASGICMTILGVVGITASAAYSSRHQYPEKLAPFSQNPSAPDKNKEALNTIRDFTPQGQAPHSLDLPGENVKLPTLPVKSGVQIEQPLPPELLQASHQIEHLDLSNKNLKQIPSGVAKFENLKSVTLDNNPDLNSLPKEWIQSSITISFKNTALSEKLLVDSLPSIQNALPYVKLKPQFTTVSADEIENIITEKLIAHLESYKSVDDRGQVWGNLSNLNLGCLFNKNRKWNDGTRFEVENGSFVNTFHPLPTSLHEALRNFLPTITHLDLSNNNLKTHPPIEIFQSDNIKILIFDNNPEFYVDYPVPLYEASNQYGFTCTFKNTLLAETREKYQPNDIPQAPNVWDGMFNQSIRQEQAQDDDYVLLGVSRDSSDHEIRKAYHKLAFKYHPDKNSEQGASELYKKVVTAYQRISKKH